MCTFWWENLPVVARMGLAGTLVKPGNELNHVHPPLSWARLWGLQTEQGSSWHSAPRGNCEDSGLTPRLEQVTGMASSAYCGPRAGGLLVTVCLPRLSLNTPPTENNMREQFGRQWHFMCKIGVRHQDYSS